MTTLFLLFSMLAAFAGEISVIGSLSREAALQPGGKSEGTILVRNNGDEPRVVLVHSADYQFSADGQSDYTAPGTLPRSNSGWILFNPEQATIAPHATASFYYSVQAPSDPTLQGTYWSLLLAEAPVEPLSNDSDPMTRGVQVRTVIRYGIAIITEVGPPAPGKLVFERGAVAREDGSTVLTLDIGNPSIYQLSPQVWMDVFDADGVNLGRFRANRRPRLLPGCSARYLIDLSSLPPGMYSGLAIADAGSDQVFGADYTLDTR